MLTVHLEYNRVKNQLDVQLILSIFRQPLHVRAYLGHHQEVQSYVHNNSYLLFFLNNCCPGWIGTPIHPSSRLKRIISTRCCIHVHTVVRPDYGPRYARNMRRLTKYTKNKLCIKLVFLYMIIKEEVFVVHSARFRPSVTGREFC